jgi:hypothetical protein
VNRKPLAPKVHRIITRVKAPAQVPDNKRPLNDKGLPGGLKPDGFKPGWSLVQGSGTIHHTHS